MYESSRAAPGRFWRVRLSRKQFWLGYALLAVATIVLALFWPRSINGGFVLPWVLLHAWRMHDFGRSGLWALAFMTAIMLLLSGLVVLGAGAREADWGAYLALLGLMLPFLFSIWVGLKPGDHGENRYGWTYGQRPPRPRPVDFS